MMASQFHTLKEDQKPLIKEIDKIVKNKWNFRWSEEEVTVKEFKVKIGDSIQKINLAGKATCKLCHAVINYGGRGKGALKEHLSSEAHYKKLKLKDSNYNLGSFSGKKDKLFPLFEKCKGSAQAKAKNCDDVRSKDEESSGSGKKGNTVVPLADRVSTMEAYIMSKMMEHTMPETYATVLVDVARFCAKDTAALAQVNLSSFSAAYKLKYGLAKTITESLVSDLQTTPFSLNIDEATSSSNKKVLSVLVRYIKKLEVRVHHLASVEIMKCDSETIYDAIVEIFKDHSLPWGNLVSILFDSCAVMRGHISGVETRIRETHAPQLLDIDGDSCHHMNNVAKKFCSPFQNHLENLFSDLHTDFKWCTQHKSYLQELCSILKLPYCIPQFASATRWLSTYDRAMETTQMLDAYKLFYFSFLGKKDKDLYLPVIKQIMVKNKLNLKDQKNVLDICATLGERKKTKLGEERKARIVDKILFKSKETELQLELYISVLAILKEYVCFFQTKEPQVHRLHEYQDAAAKKLFHCFVRPECMGDSLNDVHLEEKNLLPLRHIFIGRPKQQVPASFLEKAKSAYLEAGQQMQKCLLKNETLESIGAIDPSVNNHFVVKVHLEKLATKTQHLFDGDELDKVKEEIRQYVNDRNLPSFDKDERIDKWWCGSVIEEKYPLLQRMVKAIVTVFHGAQVESTFSFMSRIINKQTSRLAIGMLSAIQTVKYELLSNRLTSCQYFNRREPLYDPVCHQLCINMRSAYRVYETKRKAIAKMREMNKKINKAAPTMTAVKKLTALAKKRQLVKSTQSLPKSKRRRLE